MNSNKCYFNTIILSLFPIHNKDIYKIFTGSKQSVQTNLPAPPSFNISNKACISLDACIGNVLGHEFPIIFTHDSLIGTDFVGLHGSEQCQRVVNGILASASDPANTSVMVSNLLWDGFLGSKTRQKDNSVWAMSVTLSHTGVLALGWCKNDCQPVFDHFTNEVAQLHTPKLCYCSVTNLFQWVSFGLCLYLPDRP